MESTTNIIQSPQTVQILQYDESMSLYEFIRDNSPWNSGILSRTGVSRLQCHLSDCIQDVQDVVLNLVRIVLQKYEYVNTILGIYMNYYRNGSDYCPRHQHRGTKQIIISLGCNRPLNINGRNYPIQSGFCISFGEEYHSLNKCSVNEGRISIAIFYI